jgi:hypothetical protein
VVAIDAPASPHSGQWPWPRRSSHGSSIGPRDGRPGHAFDVVRRAGAPSMRPGMPGWPTPARVPVVVGHGFTFEARGPAAWAASGRFRERQRGDQPPRRGTVRGDRCDPRRRRRPAAGRRASST